MADYSFPSFQMKRVRFYNGQFLRDEEFVEDQKYHIDRQRRHERLLHVAGITEGLVVTAASDGKSVTVSTGSAIDDQGRQILLDKATAVNIPAGATGTMLLELSFSESESDPSDPKSTVKANTRFVQNPSLTIKAQRTAGSVLLAELPINAGTGTTGAPILTNRINSGVHLPGPIGSPDLSLRARPDGKGAALSGGLATAGLLEAPNASIAGDLSSRTLSAAGGGLLNINADSAISGTLNITKGLTVGLDSSFTGALNVTKGLTVGLDSSFTSALNVTKGLTVGADSRITGSLLVTNALTVNNGLSVTGVSTLLGSLRFAGSATRLINNQGFNILETNATDWLRINPEQQFPAIAVFRPLAVGTGGLAVGEFSQQPPGIVKVTGGVGIGVAPVVPLHIRGPVGGGIRLDNPTNGGDFFQIYYEGGNNTVVFYHASGAGQFMRLDGAWNQNSDVSLKENITELRGVLDKVMQLRPVSFDWKSSATPSIGFIAQDVEPVFPELVSEHTPEEGKALKGLPYATFSVLAVAAIKEMKSEYDARLRALEEQIAALTKMVHATGREGA